MGSRVLQRPGGVQMASSAQRQGGGKRLAHDLDLVARIQPEMAFYVDEKHNRVYVAGPFVVRTDSGVPLRHSVRIEFSQEYPWLEPRAFDIGNRFCHNAEHHFFTDGQCCLWLPPERRWDPADLDALKGFLIEVGLFFIQQLVFEQSGSWPGPQRPHGVKGYLEYLKVQFETDERGVAALLAVLADKTVIGRNGPCPCGSGRKFKGCHLRPLDRVQALVSPEMLTQVTRVVNH